jgi:uncharacterized protein YfkK (UPF0435 family)
MRGRAGQIVGSGFSGKKSQLGVRITPAVKKLGCANLKALLEADKIVVNDYNMISELTTFIQKKNSFEAEEGSNDDLVSCLIIFAWLIAQDYFKEMTSNDVRKRLYEEKQNQMEEDMSPFGFIETGLSENFVEVEKETGDRWIPYTTQEFQEYTEMAASLYDKNSDFFIKNESNSWNLDEYGDSSYMWDYR